MVAPGRALDDVIGAIDVAVGAVRTDVPEADGARAGREACDEAHPSVLVENKPGVLSRVTGLISRRGFNIESLSVGPTEDPTMSRVTAIVHADDVAYEQITKQLHKLISVHKINRPHRRGRHRARARAVQGGRHARAPQRDHRDR